MQHLKKNKKLYTLLKTSLIGYNALSVSDMALGIFHSYSAVPNRCQYSISNDKVGRSLPLSEAQNV